MSKEIISASVIEKYPQNFVVKVIYSDATVVRVAGWNSDVKGIENVDRWLRSPSGKAYLYALLNERELRKALEEAE